MPLLGSMASYLEGHILARNHEISISMGSNVKSYLQPFGVGRYDQVGIEQQLQGVHGNHQRQIWFSRIAL